MCKKKINKNLRRRISENRDQMLWGEVNDNRRRVYDINEKEMLKVLTKTKTL